MAINHTQAQLDNDITFHTRNCETIPANSRVQVKIKPSKVNPMEIPLPCIAELHPVNPSNSECPKVVPTLNQLSVEGHTEIMVVNNTEQEVSIKAGTVVATASVNDILHINQEDTQLEQLQILHCDENEQVATVTQSDDSTAHKSKLLSDSAIINKDPIPLSLIHI